jgi:hypothetical protein
MIIKLLANQHFTGELFKTQFVNGVSQEHVTRDTFDRIKDQLGLEPQVIQGDDFCIKCEELKKEIEELKLKLKKKTKE